MKFNDPDYGKMVKELLTDDIKLVNSLESDTQKIVIFDDFICDKNQKPLIDYFIQGRHKNCSVIYLSKSFYKTSNDIRLNCSHYVIYDFPSSNERNMISRELNVTKDQYIKATKQPTTILIPVCGYTNEDCQKKLLWKYLIH